MSQPEIQQSPSEETTLLARGYKILKKLGEGSFAKVFLAEYKPSNEPNRETTILACKIIDTSKAPKDFVKKFLPRELDVLVKLNHPHVVHVHSIFQRRSRYFIFMRFAEKGDLLEFTLKNGPISETQARIWLRQLALALQYLHELEIAHRDIKCENVLLTENLNAKLTDFGFSRYVIDSRGKKILSDTFCGSLMYVAPEILRGSPYNPKIADVWSLGVILYIMLNKAMPFDETNLKRLYELQMNHRWKFRRKVIDSLSEQVKKLVGCMLHPDSTKRWRMEQIVHCNWITMDPRLVGLTSAEQTALNNATEERRKKIDTLTNRRSIYNHESIEKHEKIEGIIDKEIEEVTIIKDPGKLNFDVVDIVADYSNNLNPETSHL